MSSKTGAQYNIALGTQIGDLHRGPQSESYNDSGDEIT